MEKFRPYRKTTTFTYFGCTNRAAILSPSTFEGMERIVNKFGELLGNAFTITRHERSGLLNIHYHRFWEPGKQFGYTMGATLAASDASVHTYPEFEFGAAYELELNLCYLWLDVVAQHDAGIRCVEEGFGNWLCPTSMVVEESGHRYFRPIAVAA